MEDYQGQMINNDKKYSKSSMLLVLVISGILFLPATILAVIIYFLFFRTLKWKPKITSILMLLLCLVWYITVKITDPFVIFEITRPVTWKIPYLFINVPLGVILGTSFIYWQASQLQAYPELKQMPGWAYKFEYAPTPLDVIKKEILIKGCKKGEYNSYEAAPIGVLEEPVKLRGETTYNKCHVIDRYYSEAYKSTLVTGATGSGKSLTMLNLMRNDILAGYPICVIDFKKGPDMAYFLSKWAYENDRQFYHFTSGRPGTYKNPYCKHQASYDPLSTGNANSKADMMLNLRKWDTAADLYRAQTESILRSIFYLLENVDREALPKIPWEEGGIAQFVAALNTSNLGDMIDYLRKDMSLRNVSQGEEKQLIELQNFYHDLTSSAQSDTRKQMTNLGIICRTLIMSSYSDWLAKGETPNHINLFEIATSKEAPIVLFQFNPNEEPEFAKYMGSIIMQDLSRASAYKNSIGDKTPFGLYIDEIQTLEPETFTGIIEKARSAKFFTTFSSQSLEQIAKNVPSGGEEVLRSILDTASNFIIHNGLTEDTALKFSKIVGKDDKTVYRVMGKRDSSIFGFNRKSSRQSMVNKSIEQEYRLLPSELQTLSSPVKDNGYKSTGYYITKQCSDPRFSGKTEVIARKFHSVVHESILEPVPEDFVTNLLGGSFGKRVQSQENWAESPITTKPLEEIEDEDLFSDNIFKLEEIKEEDYQPQVEISKPRKLENIDLERMKDLQLTDKEFADKHRRKSLEPERKVTSFEQMMAKQGVKKVKNNNSLPDLD